MVLEDELGMEDHSACPPPPSEDMDGFIALDTFRDPSIRDTIKKVLKTVK